MTADLIGWVHDQIEKSGLDDEVGLLVLAALEGDHELDDYLSTGSSTARGGERADQASVAAPGGTFLASITVEGFRGIGPPAILRLSPRPGLTIVAGRNGSGKSSLSEALELVLTGGTYRWDRKSSVEWRSHWRNLHHPQPSITVDVVEEASGPITISTVWGPGETNVDRHTTRIQRKGEKQQDGLGDLGWSVPLEQYRPILSYDELGGLLESGRSQLYDALASILGVEQLTDALKRIQSRLKSLKAPGTALAAARKTLLAEASSLDDERAIQAATVLRKTAPDVGALRALVTGSVVVNTGPIPQLRALSGLVPPTSTEQASALAQRLRAAVAGLADAQADALSRRATRLHMLEQALALHAEHGDMTCPVCHGNQLDDAWATASRDIAAAERKALGDLDLAQDAFRGALADGRRVLAPRPAMLDRSPVPELDEVVLLARDAWDAWHAGPSGSDAAAATSLADHLEQHVKELAVSLEALRTAATAQVTALDDVWQPLATRIGGWCDQWDAWLRTKPVVDLLAAAEKWLKENDLRLKNERLAPIQDGARDAWSKLRQESNVELGTLSLAGSGNQRRVKIDATVDGADAGGIAVLSQGELHALALALFLPRATMAESPFRFVVLDDPVQAMDPAKVDGLVELLSEMAQTRQVVVLSHDDRLPAAARRAGIGATILEVSRGHNSQVSIVTSTDPATRYLADAFGMVKEWEEDRLSEVAMRRTLPGLLRFAVEAAAKDRYFTRRLTNGDPLANVEAAWTNASTARERVTLAVFGEARPNHELDAWAGPSYRKFGLRNVGTAMHKGLKPGLDPRGAARDVQRLVGDIATGAS